MADDFFLEVETSGQSPSASERKLRDYIKRKQAVEEKYQEAINRLKQNHPSKALQDIINKFEKEKQEIKNKWKTAEDIIKKIKDKQDEQD